MSIKVSKLTGRPQQDGQAFTERNITWYLPVIPYTYAVQGREYASDRYSIDGLADMSHEDALAVSRRYRDGAPVTVRYNPTSPGDAVLLVEAEWTRVALHLFVGGMLVCGALYLR